MAIARPDPTFTPGQARQLTRDQVCAIRWGKDRRHVTESMKRQVAAHYRVKWENRAKYEFDHLIPRELGGADDIRNLWPQPLSEAVHKKDPLENVLHRRVCAGEISLEFAQEAISSDWFAAYRLWVTDAGK